MEVIQKINITTFKTRNQPFSIGVILFAVGVVATVVVFFGWGLVDIIGNYSKGEEPPVDTSYPRLAKDMDDRVAIALNAQNVQDPASLASNFNDKLSGANSATPININMPPQSSVPPQTPTLPPLSVKAKTFPTDGVTTTVVPAGNQTALIAANTERFSATERLNERNNQIRRGNQVDPLPEIYNIDEVTPLGVVGDQRKREVLFYSPITKQTFSAPLGTKFRNGSLEDAAEEGNTVEGVRFRRSDNGALETRAWARNSQGKTSDSADQPVLAKEPVMTPNRPQKARRQQ